MDIVSEEYGVDQAATGPDRSESAVSVRGLVKRYGSHEAVAGRHPPSPSRRLCLHRQQMLAGTGGRRVC